MEHKATNAARVAAALKRHGVTEIFGQSNPYAITLACMAIGIRQIAYRQENAGAYMAQGYGMCSGKVPVVTAQNGPAAALLVPGLAECLKASHPIVALVQDVPSNVLDRNAFQEMDHVGMFSCVTKWVRRIPCQERIEDYVDMAFMAAASGRPGPAVLLCPSDMFFDKTEHPANVHRRSSCGTYPLDRCLPDPMLIKEAARLLAGAKRPFVYAGGGVNASQARAELRALQEQCSLPVATSTMGKGSVDESHPLSVGPIGYYMGRRGVAKFMKPMVSEADVVLLVGNRTNQNGTDSWTLLPQEARYIHIDVDPMEVGRNYESLRLVGDAKLTLEALRQALLAEDLAGRKQARPAVEAAIAKAKADHMEEAKDAVTSDKSPIRVERFLAEADRLMDDDHIIVADASLASVWLANCTRAVKDRKFVFPRGIAGLGWGLPLAMGAKLARPGSKVFCLVGDGGFAHVWSELETCRRENIDVVVAVINNGILAYQKYVELVLMGAYTNACDLTPVDHTIVAKACGVTGLRVEKAEDIAGALREAFACKGTVVVDFVADPDGIPPIPMMDYMNV